MSEPTQIVLRLPATLLADIDEVCAAFGISRNAGVNTCLSSSFLQAILAQEKARARQAERRQEAELRALAAKENRARRLLKEARDRVQARKAQRP